MLEPFKLRAYYVEELGYDYVNPFVLRRRQTPPRVMPEFLEGLPTAVTELLRGAFLQGEYRSKFGFPLVTAETLNELSKLLAGKRVLDAGSGTGFLSHALSERGISVFAVDNESADYGFSTVFRRDASLDAPTLLPEEFDAVILSWPCRATDFAYRVALSMRPGATLVSREKVLVPQQQEMTFFGLLESGQDKAALMPRSTLGTCVFPA